MLATTTVVSELTFVSHSGFIIHASPSTCLFAVRISDRVTLAQDSFQNLQYYGLFSLVE